MFHCDTLRYTRKLSTHITLPFIFSLERLASEDALPSPSSVSKDWVRVKGKPVLIYGLECFSLYEKQLLTLSISQLYIRFLMKLFNSANTDVICGPLTSNYPVMCWQKMVPNSIENLLTIKSALLLWYLCDLVVAKVYFVRTCICNELACSFHTRVFISI